MSNWIKFCACDSAGKGRAHSARAFRGGVTYKTAFAACRGTAMPCPYNEDIPAADCQSSPILIFFVMVQGVLEVRNVVLKWLPHPCVFAKGETSARLKFRFAYHETSYKSSSRVPRVGGAGILPALFDGRSQSAKSPARRRRYESLAVTVPGIGARVGALTTAIMRP